MPLAQKRLPGSGWTGLEHGLSAYFAELRHFESTRQLRASALYRHLRADIDRVMDTLLEESYLGSPAPLPDKIRAVAWNVERGTRLEGILDAFSAHPRLQDADIFLLTELDCGMARSGNLFIAREIARAMKLHFAFANCYISLVKGSGLEYHVEGENRLALHGNALLARFPIRRAHAIALPNGKDKMRGKEKRLGYQQAVAGIVDHPQGPLWAVSLHLDAHSSQRHRYRQMKLVLDHLAGLEPRLPVLIGGDWNTSTYNAKRATYSILGYARRVLMGINNVLRNHYPYPDRWFERHLFRELERRGYQYKSLNQPGGCTLHYDVDNVAINTNMGDWVPRWCFWFINWALQRAGGKCSMKLDWFAGCGIRPISQLPPCVISEVNHRRPPLSDHDPIALDFRLQRSGLTAAT